MRINFYDIIKKVVKVWKSRLRKKKNNNNNYNKNRQNAKLEKFSWASDSDDKKILKRPDKTSLGTCPHHERIRLFFVI